MATSSSRALENACAPLTLIEEDEEGLIVGDDDFDETGQDLRLVLVEHEWQ